MKYILTLLWACSSVLSNAQTLIVTKLTTYPNKNYQEIAKNVLGKSITLKFYDNALSIKIQGEKDPNYLQKTSDNNYSSSEKEGYYTVLVNATIDYTFGVVTSITLNIAKKRDTSYGNDQEVQITAKRF